MSPLLVTTFQQGFWISKNFEHATLENGGRKPWTDKQTHTRTIRLIESISPEGRCFEIFWGWFALFCLRRLKKTQKRKKRQPSTKHRSWKSQEKLPQNGRFYPKMHFLLFLGSFSWFFQERCFVEGCGFLRCVQCPKTLNLSIKDNIWK